jgi:hypothetical protein
VRQTGTISVTVSGTHWNVLTTTFFFTTRGTSTVQVYGTSSVTVLQTLMTCLVGVITGTWTL